MNKYGEVSKLVDRQLWRRYPLSKRMKNIKLNNEMNLWVHKTKRHLEITIRKSIDQVDLHVCIHINGSHCMKLN